LSKAVKHHWYGDTSPWTEQRLEDHAALNGRRALPPRQADWKAVILDGENPPQLPPVVDSWEFPGASMFQELVDDYRRQAERYIADALEIESGGCEQDKEQLAARKRGLAAMLFGLAKTYEEQDRWAVAS
jgi:hypothetical protein